MIDSMAFPDIHEMKYQDAIQNSQLFAMKLYGEMAADGFPELLETALPERAEWKAREQDVRDWIKAHGGIDSELETLLGNLDDAAFDFAMACDSEGRRIGVCFEKFRQSLLQDREIICPDCNGKGSNTIGDTNYPCQTCRTKGVLIDWRGR